MCFGQIIIFKENLSVYLIQNVTSCLFIQKQS